MTTTEPMAQLMKARVTWLYLALCALALIAVIANGADPLQPTPADLLIGVSYGPSTYADGEFWRLLTAAFLHYGVIHFGVNALFLLRLGPPLEELLGPLRFALVLVVSALGASLASVAWTPVAASAGASGALFGVAGAWAMVLLFARDKLAAPTLQRLKRSVPSIILVNLAIGALVPFVDNGAHVGGLVAGALLSAALLTRVLAQRALALALLLGASAATLYAGMLRVESAPSVVAQRALLDALSAQTAGDHAAMLTHLDRALGVDPENSTALYLRGTEHFERQRWPLAEKDSALLLQLIAHKGKELQASPEQLAHVRRVHILSRAYAGDGQGALDEWAKQRELSDADPALELGMCGVLARHSTKERALEACDRAVSTYPEMGASWSMRSQAKEIFGDLPGSLADAQRAVELEPSALHLNNLAWYELRDGKLDDANAHIEQALQQEQLPHAYGTRGWIRFARGDREGALADLRKAQELVPDVAFDKGMLLYVEGKRAEGIAVWRAFLEKEPWHEPFVKPWITTDPPQEQAPRQ